MLDFSVYKTNDKHVGEYMKKTMLSLAKVLSLLITMSILNSCSGGGGGGGTGNNPAPPTPSSSSLSVTNNSTQLPLANINEVKNLVLTVTNTGAGTTSPLSSSSTGQSQISFNFSDCVGKALAPSQTCTISVSFQSSLAGVFSKTISVTGGSSPLSIPIVGYVYNNNDIDTIIQKLVNQEGYIERGAWSYSRDDLAYTTFITQALMKGESYTNLLLYTPNIDFANTTCDNVSCSWSSLDKALNYLSYDETDNTLLVYDKDAVGTDFDTTQTKWQFNLYAKPKQVSAGLLYKQNELYKMIYGTDMPNFTALYNKYLDNRKIINLDNVNNVTGSTSSIKAQLAFLLDDKRWPSSFFYIEDPMKEVLFLFESLKALNKNAELYELARLYTLHWEYTLPEIQNLVDPLISQTPDVINPGQNLKYNPTEFNYTSYQIPGNFPPMLSGQRNIPLWYVNDYQNQGYGCRNLAYTVLNLSYAYLYGNWSTSEKAQVGNLVKDGIIEMKQSYSCKYNSLTKKYTSHIDSPGVYNQNNAIPVIAKIYTILPNSIISAQEKIEIYTQLLQELGTGGSMNLSGNVDESLLLAEVLDFLMSLKQ